MSPQGVKSPDLMDANALCAEIHDVPHAPGPILRMAMLSASTHPRKSPCPSRLALLFLAYPPVICLPPTIRLLLEDMPLGQPTTAPLHSKVPLASSAKCHQLRAYHAFLLSPLLFSPVARASDQYAQQAPFTMNTQTIMQEQTGIDETGLRQALRPARAA